MLLKRITQGYVIFIALASIIGLVYVYAFPPKSMFATRDGVPHFTPKVTNPETGKPLDVGELIRHYRGD